jgi:hypothetical protein
MALPSRPTIWAYPSTAPYAAFTPGTPARTSIVSSGSGSRSLKLVAPASNTDRLRTIRSIASLPEFVASPNALSMVSVST